MTNLVAARPMTLHTQQRGLVPATSFDSARHLAERRNGRCIDFVAGKPPHGDQLRFASLQDSQAAGDCYDVLKTLTARLRRLSSLTHVRLATSEETAATVQPGESGVDACVLDVQRLVAVLREDSCLERLRLERELLDMQRELRQTRLELLESQSHAERARHAATHDALTGLPNRISFEARSRRALAAHAPHDRKFGVMYIDLDGFKTINDTHGHGVGDELLKVVGSRLARTVRFEDSISRHGGDEFLCLLDDIQSEEQVAAIAGKLFDAVSAPCQLGPLALSVRPSIGVAVYPRDGTTVESLLESADSAMFWAKKHRRGHVFFSQLRTNTHGLASESTLIRSRSLPNSESPNTNAIGAAP